MLDPVRAAPIVKAPELAMWSPVTASSAIFAEVIASAAILAVVSD